ncbi:exopolysaccharide biosynthesis protein [Desulfocapsa sulfexigens DSM 10523]|uniref:Exopolysaccharide biosynthesis protein n=1 Tax=Desulfocapsa sulfexigens (strain DSM 10523 / SB164P1) TaxID=1167006 RepID=M1PEA4_DESSD|nr:polysaccharide pyruvyl transferase family protein [Desulfocapsa sulfexigens]AGF79907.1 exopolysaccharide biosynthesis protein [Desulfocapsa sulfexigens DSM 10523]
MSTKNSATTSSRERLRDKLVDTYSCLRLADRSVILVDLPNHLNIGDSLIALGQFKLLKKYSPNYKYIGAVPPDKVLRLIDKERGVVLIHGGGNFGTIWPTHQRLRERIAKNCPNSTIYQLPQSVNFDSSITMAKSMEILAQHGDFHLMVRDIQSQQILVDSGVASIELVPDSAFALTPKVSSASQCDILLLSRQDSESQYGGLFQQLEKHISNWKVLKGDWADVKDLPISLTPLEHLASIVPPPIIWRTNTQKVQYMAWSMLLWSRYSIGVRLLSTARVIVTDRLHVHILCVLLGKPHVFFDNSYQKITNFADTWQTKGPEAIGARDLKSVLEVVDRLLHS